MTAVLRAHAQRVAKPDTEAEWLALRATYPVTASSIGALPEFDCHPQVSPVDLWCEQTMGVTREVGREARRGQRLEPFVAQWFADDCGIELVPADLGDWNGLLLATPDFEQPDDVKPSEGYEIKTHRRPWNGIPDHVRLQCIGQILARGWDQVLVVEFGPSLDYEVHTVRPTVDELAMVADAVRGWSHRLTIGAVPAPRSLDQARQLWPNVVHDDIADVEDPFGLLAADAVDYLATQTALKAAERDQDERKARLAALVADHRAAQVGTHLVQWNDRKGATYLDLDALADAHPDIDLEQYQRRRPATRTFTVKETTR